MLGIDLIAAGGGLSSQVMLVRIQSIDSARLQKAAVGDKWYGAAIGPALAVADQFPATAMAMLVPSIKGQLASYGIQADVSVAAADAPAPPARPPHEGTKILGVGAALGVLLAIGARWLYIRFWKRSH